MPTARFVSVLRTLVDHRADFIVVGGLAAILRGALINTVDIDIVHARTPENIARMLAALQDLDAYYRLQPERRFRPNESHLAAPGHQLLMTRFGMVDVLGTIGKGKALSYEDLLPHATELEVAPNLRVRVLDVETLLALKEELRRDKDIGAIAALREILKLTKTPNPHL